MSNVIRLAFARCAGCGRRYTVRRGVKPSCDPCNEVARAERDDRGRMLRGWNRAGQLVYLAASASRLEQFGNGPGRALAPADGITTINGGRA